MTQTLNIEMYGPCDSFNGPMPEVNDTVAVIRAGGVVSLLLVTKVEESLHGTDVWTNTAERLRPSDCYLLYSVDRSII